LPNYRTQKHRNSTSSTGHREKLSDRLRDIKPLLKPGIRILEIGCAEGSLGQLVRGIATVTYTGIELSADAESAARVLDRVLRSPAATLANEHFDLLLSFHVLEHIEDIAGELAHWRRLLADDGRLLIEVPNQAGHRLLDMDPNLEHIHQFTPASLAALLQHSGFAVERLQTGHAESSVYSDSLRVVARPALNDAQQRTRLLQRFLARLPESFAAWGIGGDFRGYVEPLLEALPVAALIDNAAQRHGERHGALVVEAYDPQRHGSLPILVCSVRHRDEILSDLATFGISASRIVTLDDIFGTVEP
jgi:SAM-dependent methyltransferase